MNIYYDSNLTGQMNARQLSKLEEFFVTSYSINWVCDPQMQDLCMNYPNKLELCNYVEKIKKLENQTLLNKIPSYNSLNE